MNELNHEGTNKQELQILCFVSCVQAWIVGAYMSTHIRTLKVFL